MLFSLYAPHVLINFYFNTTIFICSPCNFVSKVQCYFCVIMSSYYYHDFYYESETCSYILHADTHSFKSNTSDSLTVANAAISNAKLKLPIMLLGPQTIVN